ncbi:MAG: hypothetical protein U0694_21615 [Anaerolineae bacterium]
MSTFRTALNNLAALTVASVQHNYDIDEAPDALTRAQLPALLVLPVNIPDVRMFKERGDGFQAVAFANGARTITYAVTHLLLVAPATSGSSSRRHLPTLVSLIDSYFAALKADLTLGGALLEPAEVGVEVGIFAHGDTKYYGCALRHTWKMEV